MTTKRDLVTRLDDGGVLCAEGFLFEIERRGYMASGAFVPEVALENPHALRTLHKDFQHAGSDVVQAFTYNGHREKMRVLGKEELLEPLNKAALQIATDVANDVPEGIEPNLVAGNISNTNLWHPDDKNAQKEVRKMFDEMIGWAVDAGVDLIIGETFYYAGEAFAALEAIQQSGLPAVVTISPMGENKMRDDWDVVDTCAELEQRGATVTGMNCFRGPQTMMPYIHEIRKRVKCHVAALPITFRTTPEHPTFFNLPDNNGCTCPAPHGRSFPTALEAMSCNRYEIRAFADEAWALGVNYLGVCCGAVPIYIREVAEAMGRRPPASRYDVDMSRHFIYGSHERLANHITSYGDRA
ncbi:homocysteine S-methyltransferase family protein [Candidatus Persebacteraceae bacterium Df01]|uniref:Homocysteine S-methyltransferase family protein n=1 Tax=Candidatus Doriopsillibacter californiensis TaxID=2970740 RepID=A0ABT7QLL8_9GAMM|nr:homocysteine S-methyltransferase family protein [Candidatus Persebacteraceae bacterium Df01]